MGLCVFEPGAEAGGDGDETSFLNVDVGFDVAGGSRGVDVGLDRGGGRTVDRGAKEVSQ